MTTILQLNSSIYGEEGQSSRLADEFVSQWRDREPTLRLIRRDLAKSEIPHLSAQTFQAALTPKGDRSAAQAAQARLADELVDELLGADVLVLGLPMYNFGVPSVLKAWFDHVARAGTTFSYTANGPVGHLDGRKAYVFATRGGQYAGTSSDHQVPFVSQFLSFLGIEDIEFVYAEGLAISEETREAALRRAGIETTRLAA